MWPFILWGCIVVIVNGVGFNMLGQIAGPVSTYIILNFVSSRELGDGRWEERGDAPAEWQPASSGMIMTHTYLLIASGCEGGAFAPLTCQDYMGQEGWSTAPPHA